MARSWQTSSSETSSPSGRHGAKREDSFLFWDTGPTVEMVQNSPKACPEAWAKKVQTLTHFVAAPGTDETRNRELGDFREAREERHSPTAKQGHHEQSTVGCYWI
eukprot:gnl/TRDRNA2_/TRDRNA2_170939_c1_seq11.p1 gnl/TRDRNA2_/TRDRNA2_170939_c1~~gnl/TRDRNA2_/TRDRNA2_170939_c1_seq11.p1  ORF type:complete len:105 (-),score=9.24 gnl/TRDRNA2_/TRDRNA2_170939_c1_seq11:94-408(-)